MRNAPLKGLMKKSPMRVDKKTVASTVVEVGKTFAKNLTKKALGVVGAFIDPVTTSKTDQPGTGKHGGKKSRSIRNMKGFSK